MQTCELANCFGYDQNVLPFIVLGIVQGLAEFLPISSSAHLILIERFFNVVPSEGSLNAMLHLGTLLAVFYYFRRRLWQLLRAPFKRDENLRLLFLLITATLPTAVIGFFLKTWAEAASAMIWLVGLALVLTGVLMYLVEAYLERKRPSQKDAHELNLTEALLIGVMQGFAVFPGLSRSGLTIAMGLWRGLNREAAVEFSFVLSIPAVLGNALLSLPKASPQADTLLSALIAAIVGVLAIRLLLYVLIQKGLKPFAYYLWVVGPLASILAFVLS